MHTILMAQEVKRIFQDIQLISAAKNINEFVSELFYIFSNAAWKNSLSQNFGFFTDQDISGLWTVSTLVKEQIDDLDCFLNFLIYFLIDDLNHLKEQHMFLFEFIVYVLLSQPLFKVGCFTVTNF